MQRLAAMLDLWRQRRSAGTRAAHPWRPFSLRFHGTLEREYLTDRLRDFGPLLRMTLLMSVPLYLGYLLVDYLTVQRFVHVAVYLQVFGLGIPANLAVLAALGLRRLRPHLLPLTVAACLINGLGVSTIQVMLEWMGRGAPGGVMAVKLVATLFLMALPFRYALPLALLELGIYSFGMLYLARGADVLAYNIGMLGFLVVVGALGCRLQEISHRRSWLQERHLRDLSERDALSGLYHHRTFHERLEAAVAQGRRESVPLALVLLDLDGFKQFNDRYGHPAGDEALRRVAGVIQEFVRRPGDLAARIGGEEFAVLLYATPARSAMELAEELRERIARLRIDFLELGGLRVSASIGVAIADGELINSSDRLLGLADDALYRAKSGGRNCVRS